ncbi:unnamed protein product, partial [marine sediment metagenome]
GIEELTLEELEVKKKVLEDSVKILRLLIKWIKEERGEERR